MKKFVPLLLIVVFVLFLSSCAPHGNPSIHTVTADGTVAGFWEGLWHGIISPFTLIGSLFTETVNVYEVHNNGCWYNLGFLMGVGGLLEGGIRIKIKF